MPLARLQENRGKPKKKKKLLNQYCYTFFSPMFTGCSISCEAGTLFSDPILIWSLVVFVSICFKEYLLVVMTLGFAKKNPQMCEQLQIIRVTVVLDLFQKL